LGNVDGLTEIGLQAQVFCRDAPSHLRD